MAERNVSVRLSANVTSYIQAMDKARASTKQLEKESSLNMSRLGGKMQDVGKKATMGITLPLVGVGAAAIKMSNSFDAAFGQMVGLAGVAAEDVDGLKESVLDLAGETARAPQELAEALYFAASAGLDTQQAMDAVTIAAKAASAGMGTTQDIVGLAASAVASYGAENINAAEATDILVSTIREGRAEPAELASTLGRVLPIAAQLGVTFDEVGGTVAILSNVLGDTNRTVTATQGMFVKLLSPTKQGREALVEMGTSVKDLHAAVAQDGLLGALELLKSKGFDTNATALRSLFDDIEGFQAASALLATDQETLASTFGATADSAGSLETAFGALDEDAQAMKQSWVDVQVALIQVGEVIGPIVADIAGGIGDMAGAFSDLDPTLQKIIIGIAGAAAAAGPLLIVTGSLVKNYALLKTAMVGSNLSMIGSAKAAGTLAAQLGLAYVAVGFFEGAIQGLRGETEWLHEDVGGLGGAVRWLARDAMALGNGFKQVGEGFSKFEKEAEGAYGAMTAGVHTMDQLRKRLDESTLSLDARNLITVAFRKQLDLQTEAEANLTEATEEATEAAGAQADATKTASEKLSDYRKRTNDAEGALDGAYDAGIDVNAMLAAQRERAEEAAAEIQTLADEFGWLLDKMSDRGQFLDAQDGFDDVQAAAEDAYTAAAEGSEDAERKSRDHERAVNALKEDVIGYADEVKSIPPEQVSEIIALIDQGALAEAEAALERLERNRTVSYNAVVYARAGGSYGDALKFGGPLADGGPTYPNTIHEVNENGSELFTENGRTYLMSSTNGFVTPTAAAPPATSTADAGTRIGVNVEKLIDRSGHSLEDVFRAANAHLALGV